MEQLQIRLELPGSRDGSPLEVARGTLDDLDELARQLAPIFHQAEQQVRNAVLDQLVDEDTDTAEAGAIYAQWERGRFGAAVAGIGATGADLRRRVADLQRALR